MRWKRSIPTTPPPDRAPVTEEMIEAALFAAFNNKRKRYNLPVMPIDELKATEQQAGHWEIAYEDMRLALEAALAAREAQKGKGNTWVG